MDSGEEGDYVMRGVWHYDGDGGKGGDMGEQCVGERGDAGEKG